jgi:cytochrome c biogenesis protein CcmG/thiol:disulfide interchange protein DsbE
MRSALIVLVIIAASHIASAEEPLDLDSHQGKVVLVDFWASWCVPCRRSFPWMNDMHRKYEDDGLIIIAVNLDRETEDANAFLEAYPADFAVNYDPDGDIATKYQVEVMPSSLLFGRDGNLTTRHAGFKVKRQDEYEAVIRSALGLEHQN